MRTKKVNYVVLTKDGVGMVVTKEEWEEFCPGLLKTTMSDEEVSTLHSFKIACSKFMEMFI